ncbi:MAG TPA: paraquat-inducible protein A [Bryobacteraceae bacterium]|jgi:hypothetical protein|nr:paraquat-inducible protein A [Bryobacteraceae bacterium]
MQHPSPSARFDFRLAAALLLLGVAITFTWRTVDGLSARRKLRTELAELEHVRYGLLNADRWVERLVPILDAQIDALDLNAAKATLRPMVQSSLYRLLDQVKDKMSAKPAQSSGGLGGLFSQGNSMIVNMVVGSLKPHIPEYTETVLAELGRPEARAAVKKYIRGVLADGARNTFGGVDMRTYDSILRENGCADGAGCRQQLVTRLSEMDRTIWFGCGTVLAATALAFLLLLTGRPMLSRPATIVCLLFCMTLLIGGVITPMLEVEAKISALQMTFLGQPIAFTDQVLYFQSKSVLEVFRVLITYGRPDMWVVGVLVLMFSIIFPALKILTSAVCLFQPRLLRTSRIARFFVLESSKWSMADVMALAIFMAFVAFNGLIANSMNGLAQSGAQLTIPTDSSRILAGYYLFIGYCMASLFLARKLARGLRAPEAPRVEQQAAAD